MASDTSASFDKCLEKFRKGLTEAQKREFSSTDFPQVKKAIQQIQDRIGPDGKLRNLNRIKKFLEGMKQIEQLVQIFLNVHEVVAFVWGPIKLTLMMISTNVEELDLLLGAYQEIGETLHGVGKYDRLFKNSPDILLILEKYFYDILEFHTAVLGVFTKPNWKKFFRSAWPTFKTRFDPILSSLKRHKALLSDEKVTLLLEEVQDGRACIEDKLQDLSKDIKHQVEIIARDIKTKDLGRIELIRNRKSAIEMKLGPHKYNIDQSRALNQRDRSTSGNWILHDPIYEAWLNGSLSLDSFLYFSGIPGSGKTTLISRIVEHMHSQISRKLLNGVLIFFYFKHGSIGSSSRTKCEMLRAIISQLLHQDDSLLQFIHDRIASMEDTTIIDEKLLKDLAKDCLKSQSRVWLILDGLDECDELYHDGNIESCDIIRLFEQEFIPAMSAQNSHLRVLASGQRDGKIDNILSQYPAIHLDRALPHLNEINQYTQRKAALIKKRFKLSSADEMEVLRKVTSSSKGMFLYAKVVLDNLYEQESEADLEEELAGENFPQGLKEAYDRIAVRIFDSRSLSRKKSASAERILAFVMISGSRSLLWREVQSRFCIDIENASVNFKRRRLDSPKTICGSLIELTDSEIFPHSPSEQVISIVHDTASSYLCFTGRVNLLEEHARAAIYFSRYLASGPFLPGFNPTNMRRLVMDGYFSLQDYACESWQQHIRQSLCRKSELSVTLRLEIIQAIRNFLEAHPSKLHPANKEDEVPSISPNDLTTLDEPQNLENILTHIKRVICIRQTIESINFKSLSKEKQIAFEELNGLPRFKCPKVHCPFFSKGFSSEEEREWHVQNHERPFKCPVEGCYANFTGYSNESNLKVHIKRFHESDRDTGSLFPRDRKQRDAATIHSAASSGNLEKLIYFHHLGVNLNIATKVNGGITPLTLAVRKGHVHVAEYLVKHGADPRQATRGTGIPILSPIQQAIINRDYELYRVLKNTYQARNPEYNQETEVAYAISDIIAALMEMTEEILEEILKDAKPSLLRHIFAHIITKFKESRPNRFSYWENSEKWDDLIDTQQRMILKILVKVFPGLDRSEDFTKDQMFEPNLNEKELHELYQIMFSTDLYRGLYPGLHWEKSSSSMYSITGSTLDFMVPLAQVSKIAVGFLTSILSGLVSIRPLHITKKRKNLTEDFAHRIISVILSTKLPASLNALKNGELLRRAASADSPLTPLIIEHTECPNNRNDKEQTAIEIAISQGNTRAVSLILSHPNFEFNEKTSQGETILEFASQSANLTDPFLRNKSQETLDLIRKFSMEYSGE